MTVAVVIAVAVEYVVAGTVDVHGEIGNRLEQKL